MSFENKVFYVPAPASEACRIWKSLFQTSADAKPGVPDRASENALRDHEVQWRSRWGPALFDGRADFIPAAGGCVVYVSLTGIGMLSRLSLSAASKFSCGPWRPVDELPGTRIG